MSVCLYPYSFNVGVGVDVSVLCSIIQYEEIMKLRYTCIQNQDATSHSRGGGLGHVFLQLFKAHVDHSANPVLLLLVVLGGLVEA